MFSRVSALEVFLSIESLNTKKFFGAYKVHPLLACGFSDVVPPKANK